MRLPNSPRNSRLTIALLLATSTVAAACLAHIADNTTAGAIAWTDISGRKYGPADLSKNKATAFIFISTQCPISNLYIPRLLRLSNEFTGKGVGLFLVDSN